MAAGEGFVTGATTVAVPRPLGAAPVAGTAPIVASAPPTQAVVRASAPRVPPAPRGSVKVAAQPKFVREMTAARPPVHRHVPTARVSSTKVTHTKHVDGPLHKKKSTKWFHKWWFWLLIALLIAAGIGGFLAYWFTAHTSTQCPENQFFGGSGLGCVECTSASECKGGICSKNQCKECVINADCQLAQYNGSTGFLKDAKCTGDGTCTKPCTDNKDCESLKNANRICDEGLCSQCAKNSDCPSAPGFSSPKCNTQTRKCLTCGPAAPCDGGYICQDEKCVKGCKDSSECSSGEICDRGVCVVCDLKTNAGCSGSTPWCIRDADNTGVECVQCRTTTDCKSGMQCSDNVCFYPATAITGHLSQLNQTGTSAAIYNYNPDSPLAPESTVNPSPALGLSSPVLMYFVNNGNSPSYSAFAVTSGAALEMGNSAYVPKGYILEPGNPPSGTDFALTSFLRGPEKNADGNFTFAWYVNAQTPWSSPFTLQLGVPCNITGCTGKVPSGPNPPDPSTACNGQPCSNLKEGCADVLSGAWTQNYLSESALTCPGEPADPAAINRSRAMFVNATLTGNKVPSVFNLVILNARKGADEWKPLDDIAKDDLFYVATADLKWVMAAKQVGLDTTKVMGSLWEQMKTKLGTVEWIANTPDNQRLASAFSFAFDV